MRCRHCDWGGFNEDGGFYYCQRCNQLYEGVQVQIADDDHVRSNVTREVGRKRTRDGQAGAKKKPKTGRDKERPLFSKYTDIEVSNYIFIGMVEDFVRIYTQLNPSFDSVGFVRFCYLLMIKYLRESEIAFARNENKDPVVKLFPNQKYRDRNLINQKDAKDLEKMPFPTFFRSLDKEEENRDDLRVVSRTYRTRKGVKSNADYFKSPQAFKDSRKVPKKVINFAKKPERFLIKNYKKFLTQHEPEKDSLETIIENAKNNVDSQSDTENALYSEDTGICDDDEEGEGRSQEDEEEEDDEAAQRQENEKLLSTMPKRLREFVGDKPTDYFKRAQAASLVRVVSIDNRKLFCILYFAIREWKLPVFLADLVRWTTNRDIRIALHFDYLPTNFELNFMGSIYYRTGISTSLITKIINNAYVHLQLASADKIFDTLMVFIERILYDWNLPAGLKLLIELKFKDSFDDFYTKVFARRGFLPPKYDLMAVVVILQTLKSLFNFHKPELNWDAPKKIDNLFDIHAWYKWSMIRFNAIKSNIDQLPVLNDDDLLDPIEVHYSQRREYDYIIRHKEQFFTTRFTTRLRNHGIRQKLRDEYEFVFSDPDYERIMMQIKGKPLPEVGLNPMTSYAEYVVAKCDNPYLKAILEMDFRKTLITPYYYWNKDEFTSFSSNWLKFNGKRVSIHTHDEWIKSQHPVVGHLIDDLGPMVIGNPWKQPDCLHLYLAKFDHFPKAIYRG